MGGVRTGAHAQDLLDVGSTLVAAGTESFRDPIAGKQVAAELDELSAKSGHQRA
jgi:dihydroorotate dehydrogenase (NAD+) catalytic subunit